MAKKIIQEKGVVFGAAFDDEWNVSHKAVVSIEELPDVMRSKYVQSSTGTVYKDVSMELQKGRKVLLCGTPCQTRGLLAYLGSYMKTVEWQKNLITVDFICHGVPSRIVWKKYLKEVSKGRIVKSINFRDKSNGWKDFSLCIDFENGDRLIESQKINLFIRGFI